MLGYRWIMSDDDEGGLLFFLNFKKEFGDLITGFLVEGTGGFVG